MPDITLTAETGRRPGSSDARRLRSSGKIPGVVYGHGQDPLPVAVDARELRSVLTTEAGLNALLNLRVDGTSHLTLAREIQRHPVRNTVVHVDFLVVSRDEVISAEVPIALTGEAVEVERADGLVEQQLFSLTVHATPGRIPNAVEVDVSGLELGGTIRVGDLTLPDGVTTDVDPEAAVVLAALPQAADTGDEATAAEPGAEGGEG
ncbi:MAG TPA: 50S ribosomal protein L25 [Acidimicrobiales bacterium]|nr:50S ribosomal protein L25 [Acidimicrobiales bacterium]